MSETQRKIDASGERLRRTEIAARAGVPYGDMWETPDATVVETPDATAVETPEAKGDKTMNAPLNDSKREAKRKEEARAAYGRNLLPRDSNPPLCQGCYCDPCECLPDDCNVDPD